MTDPDSPVPEGHSQHLFGVRRCYAEHVSHARRQRRIAALVATIGPRSSQHDDYRTLAAHRPPKGGKQVVASLDRSVVLVSQASKVQVYAHLPVGIMEEL